MRLIAATLLACASAGAQLTTGPAELISDQYTFSEGPLWLSDGRWIFSDPPKDTIYVQDGKIYRQPSHGANGLTLDRQGRLIACESALHRVTQTEVDGKITVLAESYQGKPLNSPNDVVVRADGLVLFTDPVGLEKKDAGTGPGFSGVYAVKPGGAGPELLVKDLDYPNGIALSPDGKILYVSNTTGAQIRAYDLSAEGKVSNARDFCKVNIPDGIKVDAAGRVWSSSSKGIMVFGPDGKFIERVDFEGMPTNCAFGGADGHTLFITARKRVYRVPLKGPGIVPAALVKK